MFESQNPEKINIKNLSLDKPEKEGKTPEELREEFRDFLSDTFEKWHSDAAIKARISEATDYLPELIAPKDLRWQEKRKEGEDASKFGEYTLNPETVDIYWETIPPEKIITKELPGDLNSQQLADVAEYIIKTYGDNYCIPGLEYWKYMIEHPGGAPDNLKAGSWHFLFGSIIRNAYGDWCVPFVRWDGVAWSWRAGWLKGIWSDNCRVVLLEKSAVVRKQRKDFSKPTPPMPEIRKF